MFYWWFQQGKSTLSSIPKEHIVDQLGNACIPILKSSIWILVALGRFQFYKGMHSSEEEFHVY